MKRITAADARRTRAALFMCAAQCQGGHSDAGHAAADALGVPFPIRMPDMVRKARDEGHDPTKLWPWLVKQGASLFTAVELEVVELRRLVAEKSA